MSSEENQLNVQGYNIVTILKRLETATSRLEDITMIQDQASKSDPRAPPPLSQLPSAPAAIGAPPTDLAVWEPTAEAKEEEPEEKAKSTVVFEEFIEEHVKAFVNRSKSLDSVVGEAAQAFYEAFQEQAKFLEIASKSKKPEMTDPAFADAVNPTNTQIQKISSVKDSNRSSKFFNHLNTLAEGAPVLGWILSPTPVSYIPDFKDSAQFWSNRIMKEFRDKDQSQVDWVKEFLGIFEPLKDYVKEYHTKGPKWNPNGKPLSEVLAGASKVPAPAVGGAPPPPPPPPPPASLFDETETKSVSNAPASGMQAVFADLNKGEAITSGLKKVDKSQMTHKNPELRKQAPVVPKKPTPPKKPSSLSSGSSVPAKKPARKELIDGSKWIIENYTRADLKGDEVQSITIEAEMHQSIFVGNCEEVTVLVKGKANAISVSNTTKCVFIIDSLISGFELIKCHKFGLQILGTVADVSIDQCDEGDLYLSQDSIDKDIQIVSSSTTALNFNVPKDGDYIELAAPEQFKHSIKDNKLVSEVLQHVA
ncbi:suppressor of rasval19 [Yamadazyma tenuis]|uniref:Adenylyl cyclase-associated protein n=1 Tax=Candida tenuis (strain ATCC 10573 / BCRC 21748 / CBS 615 / JCM 9827 / NBRC 10315 / NRRL Y-1498 / VKM Y-70) TaxID=590646 RepID=G3BF49_CANTC|nr:uncharacterized protein CANTEDRAFT_100004 [Yamadazyma tenuis ATCC 10573]EGV60635.1 hypothetical protein CANTEDRAFT_100004 [Yamadazyma tenuis ATCC 10573]WEJ94117.1 suppressor of rasval19 [Yamadazyma tenuis]